MTFRIGNGIDFHRFSDDRELVLGGVTIPAQFGLEGHSDADVLTHALMDALLGGAGCQDIGHYFPPTEQRWQGARSIELLERVRRTIAQKGYGIVNVDISLVMERPKVASYVGEMKKNIAAALGIEPDAVGIKATTAERLGAVGRGEGAMAYAVALLRKGEGGQ